MILNKATDLINKYAKCPECNNGLVGNSEGKLVIEDNMFYRSCKCGFEVTVYNIKDLDVSEKQYREMKHAIGLSKDKVKRNKYAYYRNYFNTSGNCEKWDDLVLKGLATCSPTNTGMNYFVTRKGIDLLEIIDRVKITERD